MEKKNGWISYTEQEIIHRPAVGEISSLLGKNRVDNTHDVREQVSEMLKGFFDQVVKCMENGKKHLSGDFYIEVLFRNNEKVIQDSMTNIFVARPSCPTPFFDQTVYKYVKSDDKLHELWVVPDIALCELYKDHVFLCPDEEEELHKNIKDYYSGELAKIEYFENNPDKKIMSVVKGVK